MRLSRLTGLFLISAFAVVSVEAATLESIFGIDDKETLPPGKAVKKPTGKGSKLPPDISAFLEIFSKKPVIPTKNPLPLDFINPSLARLESELAATALPGVRLLAAESCDSSSENCVDDALRDVLSGKELNIVSCGGNVEVDDCTLLLSKDINGNPTGNQQVADIYFTDEFFHNNEKNKYIIVYWHGGAWLSNDQRYSDNSYRQALFINYLESLLINEKRFNDNGKLIESSHTIDIMVISVSYLEGYVASKTLNEDPDMLDNMEPLSQMYDGYTGNISSTNDYESHNTLYLNTITHSFQLILD